jgi:hypothetical protein
MAARWAIVSLALSLAFGFATLGSAGNLTVTQHGSSLSITGKGGGATAVVTSLANGEKIPTEGLVRINPADGTTVNGDGEATFTGVQNVSIKLDNAPNNLSFQSLEVAGDLKVKGGKVEDTFAIDGGSIGDDLTLDGGTGNNTLSCDGATVNGDAQIKANGLDNTTLDSNCEIAGNLKITLSGEFNVVHLENGAHATNLAIKTGIGTVTIDDVAIDADAKISMTHGANTIFFNDTLIGGSLSVTTAGGADTVKFNPITVGESAKVSMGDGRNVLLIPGTIGTSFIGTSFTVSAGGGADDFTMHKVNVGEGAIFKAGEGQNDVTVDQFAIGGDLSVTTGKGDDNYIESGSTVGGKKTIKLGAGNNTGG